MSNNNGSGKGPIAGFISLCFTCTLLAICYYYFKAHATSGEEAGNIIGQAAVNIGQFLNSLAQAIAAAIPGI